MHKIVENKGRAIAAFLLAAAASMSCMLGANAAAQIYTIEAPNGVGDVVALTNVLANLPTVSNNDYNNSRIWLEPGLYDLRGIYMTSTSHLTVKHSRGLKIAGLGNGPDKTILLGGGEAEKHRVMYLAGGGNYWWNTISNLTITGGCIPNSGGGGVYSDSAGTLYVDCIVSNNVAGANRWTSAGGCFNGCAVRCLFANNTGGYAGGGLECGQYKAAMPLQPYTVDCVFSNNVLTKTYNTSDGGGAVAGGVHTRGKFYFNSAPYGGAGGPSETSGRPVFVDCEFVGNKASVYGGALYNPAAVTNCVFVANTNTTTSAGGGAIYASSISEEGFSIVDCAFTNNVATEKHGGALLLPGGVTNCTFFGNIAGESGGAIYANGGTGSKEIVGCSFVSNYAAQGSSKWGFGGAIRTADSKPNVQIRSCVFPGGNKASHGDAVYYGDLTDCVITNHGRSGAAYILYNCNLTRCLVADNTVNGNGTSIDHSSSANAYTNVNSVFLHNSQNSSGRITCNKCIVNCTYVGNVSGNGNYGDIFNPQCIMRNCILSGNKIGSSLIDVRAIYGSAVEVKTTNALHMVSCVFVKSQSGVGEDWEGLVNCKKVADVRFVDAANGDYTPKTRSAAYDAGCQDPWIISLVGATDLAGNDRVFGGRIDIGAYESQVRKPGAMFIFR